jgi:pimeloyl-[acyl-carrier protein] synthase
VSAVDRFVIPLVRTIGQRPWLSNALFRFARYNPFDPHRYRWPYPVYDQMSGGQPVVYSKLFKDWTVFGHDEVLDVLRSSDVSTSGVVTRLRTMSPYARLSEQAFDNFSRWLLFVDPPDHSRLRGAVSRTFTPKRVAEHEPRVRAIADELLRQLADQESFDFMSGFASPFPVFVIADILGVPRDRFEWLHDVSVEIAGLLEVMRPFDPTSMNRRFRELHEEFTALIDQRRRLPQDDLISALANDSGDQLTNDEIIALITLLMFAGHETTTSLLGNAITALAAHPDQRTLLRTNGDLVANAIEELLRYDTPAQIAVRTTTAPVQAGATTIPAGANVGLVIGAANRDLKRWSDANELRLDRIDPKPISFGHGMHHCLGAALTRLEMRVALPALVDAFGDYTIDHDTVTWKQSTTLRGPTHLRITAKRAKADQGSA